jgi:hypothetical protein
MMLSFFFFTAILVFFLYRFVKKQVELENYRKGRRILKKYREVEEKNDIRIAKQALRKGKF